jgi:hypothetical protein
MSLTDSDLEKTKITLEVPLKWILLQMVHCRHSNLTGTSELKLL